jgi:hypothetical protein
MRYWRRAVVLVVACALLFALPGCKPDQTPQANKAIDAANAEIRKYTEAGTELEKLMSQAESLPMEPASAKKGIALTDQMKTKIAEQRTAAEAAKAEISKIKTLDVRQEFKTYADKELAVTDTLLKEDPVAQALIGDLRKIYEVVASGKGTQKDIDTIGKRIDTETKQLTALEKQASAQEKEASDYFDAQKLGG